MRVSINLNEYVRVKLNERGIAIMRANHEDLRKRAPSLKAFTPPKTDEDGFTSFQFWQFMQEFGPHIGMGLLPLFETTIMFDGEARRAK